MKFSDWWYGRSGGNCSKVSGSVSAANDQAIRAAYGIASKRQKTTRDDSLYRQVGKTPQIGVPLTVGEISALRQSLNLPSGAKIVGGERVGKGAIVHFNRPPDLPEEFFRQAGLNVTMQSELSVYIEPERSYGPLLK